MAHDYRGKLYFFPAVLPLMAIVPWLLTAAGTIAGIVIGVLGRKRSALFVKAGMAVCACAFLVAGILYWPSFRLRYIEQGTNLSTGAAVPVTEIFGAPEPGKVPSVTPRAAWDTWNPLWSTSTTRRALSNTVIEGDLVIVGTWEGTVDAFALGNGKPLWSVKKKEPVIALAGASKTLLLAGEGVHTSPSASLTAIRLPDGRVLWDRVFQGHLESSAAYSEEANRIWVGTGPAGLWCLDSRNGAVIWHKKGVHVDSTPLVSGGIVYFSGQEDGGKKESVFFALDQENGSESWRLTLPGSPWGSPVLDAANDQIITTSGIGQIGLIRETDQGWAHAISLRDHKLRWSRPLPGNPLESSVILPAHGLVIFTITKGEILAVRADNGKDVWSSPLGEQIVAELDLDDRQSPPRLVSLATDGKLRVQSALTGRFLDEHAFAPGNNSGPRFLPDGIVLALPQSVVRYHW